MRRYGRETIALVALLGIGALAAQLAGVGGRTPEQPAWKTIAAVPGGAVPDLTSTTLASTKVTASADRVVTMRAHATLRRTSKSAGRSAHVVCGIRYSRDGDPGWSLGTPYETVSLKRRGATTSVRIERSFKAPAKDTYRMHLACHVGAPGTGGLVQAHGTMRASIGASDAAAIPRRR